jgi:mannose-6-phosphate isomerase-like protein (cupin superfamily)
MNRYVRFAALGAAGIAGYFALHGTAFTQSGDTKGKQPQVAIFTIDGSKYPRAENGKATFWTAEELKKKYVTDPKAPVMDHLEWTPAYRISMLRRNPADPATVGGEMHEDKTQVYIIMSGSGTILIGGKPRLDASAGPGEHRSQLIDATPHHVKEGDVISIPPMTWHASYADQGQVMTYMMFHIENKQTIP